MRQEVPIRRTTVSGGWVLAACLSLILTACGGGGGDGSLTGTGTATLLITNTDNPTTRESTTAEIDSRGIPGPGPGPVPVSQIESLLVTVDEIVLERVVSGEVETPELETVEVRNFEFVPSSVTIEQGGTVRWVWDEPGVHTITSGDLGQPDGLFDESGNSQGDIVELIFNDTGAFPYFSNIQTDIDEGMAGVVNVEPPSGARNTRGTEPGDGNVELVPLPIDPVQVDLVNLSTLAEVLTSAEVPAGTYRGIRLGISDPQLRIVGDPGNVDDGPYRTNVKLTANGRLFLRQVFEIPADQEVLIAINFGGIHLVNAGASGMFVLTPQLRAEINVQDAEVDIEGPILSIDTESDILEVEDADSGVVFEVLVTQDTLIFTDDDSDDTAQLRGIEDPVVPLTLEDLQVGQIVRVVGLLTTGSQILADFIEVADEDFEGTTISGFITALDVPSDAMTVDTTGGSFNVVLNSTAAIVLSCGDDDFFLTLSDLQVNAPVQITGFDLGGGEFLATGVLIESDTFITGEITAVDSTEQTITVTTGSGDVVVSVDGNTVISDGVADDLIFDVLTTGQNVEIEAVTLATDELVACHVLIVVAPV